MSQFTSMRKASATDERRSHPRFPCSQAAFCRALQPPDYVFWTARTRDLSVAGVRLILGHHFEPGTLLAIELLNVSRSLTRERPARVVYAYPVDACRWAIGCAFIDWLSDAELMALL